MKKMSTFKFLKKYSTIILTFSFLYLNSCGLYKPVDARKVSPNASDRIKSNQEQGKGFSFGNLTKRGAGNFQFASSNEIRADGIKINIYKKECLSFENCKTSLLNSTMNNEIKLAILKKAALLKKADLQSKK